MQRVCRVDDGAMAMAKKYTATVNHLKLVAGLNTISNLTVRVGDLET